MCYLLIKLFVCLCSFESWFDIDSISGDAENIVVKEREENILHMLHQVIMWTHTMTLLKCRENCGM